MSSAPAVAVTAPMPWFGRPGDMFEAVRGLGLAAAVTYTYVFVAQQLFSTPTSGLEIASLILSLACVWLVRTENVLSMPIGVGACALLGVFYLQIELVGQGWLQLAFFIPVQLIGWWAWCRGGDRGSELKISRVTTREGVLALMSGLALWVGAWALFNALYGQTPYAWWDTSIVAASIVAQGLLTYKRIEHWLVWLVPVNVSSILLYSVTGAWAFAFLYVVFFANAAWGLVMWRRQQQHETDAGIADTLQMV